MVTQWERIKADPIRHAAIKAKRLEQWRKRYRAPHLLGTPIIPKKGPRLPPGEAARRYRERHNAYGRKKSAEHAAKVALWHHCQIIRCKVCSAPFLRKELGKNRRCKPCGKVLRLRFKELHPDRYRARKRTTRAKRRALERGAEGSCSPKQWLAVLAKYGNQCQRCGATGDLTCDHIIPLSRGGSNDPTNLQPLCMLCNSLKRNVLTGAVQACIPGVVLTHV